MNKKLISARRDVERLRLEADGASELDLKLWQAGHVVADLEQAEEEAAVSTARRAGRAMDAVLLVVALLTMAFSLGNIHDFAQHHGVVEPIDWFLAPAIDLALLAALLGDAVLSRWQLDAGPWATRLRWFAGAATVALNGWEAVTSLDPAAIVLHITPPVLLFVLAEAASPYRRQFAETVRLAAQQPAAPAPVAVDTPAPAKADTAPPVEADSVYEDDLMEVAVSTMTPQVTAPAPTRLAKVPTEADTTGDRLDAAAAKAAIEAAWQQGLTIREAAAQATRAASYVGTVYARLTRERGPQPMRGQLDITAA